VTVAGDRKLRVFISYSRKDEDFAQELLAGPQLVALTIMAGVAQFERARIRERQACRAGRGSS